MQKAVFLEYAITRFLETLAIVVAMRDNSSMLG